MKIFIDSADPTQIDKWTKKLGNSFAGVTTNLTMLRGKKAIQNFIATSYNHRFQTTMFQIENRNDLDALLQAKESFVAKLSMIEKNFKLINYIKKQTSLLTAATTCYSLIQINQAIEMDLDYSMVYYAKNTYKGLLEDAVKLKKDSGSKIKLVAASIHTVEEATHAIQSGIGYCTVRPDVLELLFNDKQAIADIERVAGEA